MLKFLVAIFVLLPGMPCKAQLLDCSKNLFSEEPFFNSCSIQEHKIRTITGELHYKRDYEKMYSKDAIVRYDFDEKGRLVRQLSTFKNYTGVTDSAVIFYHYDDYDRLITKRTSDAFGFYSLNYEYNEKDNLIKETYCRDMNANNSKSDFILGKQYPMGYETFKYEYLTPAQYKIKQLNNLGVSYKEIIVNKNENGQIIEEEGRFVVTGKIEKRIFTYDAKNRTIEKRDYSNVSGENEIIYNYRFDEAGNILEMEKLKNGNIIPVRTEFLYSNIPSLISAQISRDRSKKTIDIIKYSYEFYE